jgi:hypothetical protein
VKSEVLGRKRVKNRADEKSYIIFKDWVYYIEHKISFVESSTTKIQQ